MKLLQQRTR